MNMSLTPNTLYIALYVRTDPPVPDNFHWALAPWMASHGPESNILKTFLLVGLLRIVDIPPGAADPVDQLIRSYDAQLNDLGESSPVDAVEDGKVLDAKVDLGMLEREVMDWGNRYAAEACQNVQPRPIIDPQSAVLSNIEVLAYLTANPPRRPPKPPPNSRHWVPSPDLRDHNTVVKEIHNYVARLSPHLLNYPAYIHESQRQQLERLQTQTDADPAALPPVLPIDNSPTPLDHALRELIARLQPYGLTKGEVLMILNLGVGVGGAAAAEGEQQAVEEEGGGEEMQDEGREGGEQAPVNGNGHGHDGMDVDAEGQPEGEEGAEEAAEIPEEDYGALALLDTVIEEREERLSNEDVAAILAIIRETLGGQAPTEA
ncbi:hypothetical protein ATEIFO6365_0011036100 [Aspergillus terreus]|uniref:Uncharacterized protein n=1 Tax=Aspergillus terreus TaxID=33178 RepID=A0A5M3Z3C3_ASPTE|nr:hypothetical protein ATETN484_0006050300 [Aspergillus terreus]GFF20099.1 hypothetical protein ATEIFO6365_0011036100 [Aspergillus terreus]